MTLSERIGKLIFQKPLSSYSGNTREEPLSDLVSIPKPVTGSRTKTKDPNRPGSLRKYELLNGKWRRISKSRSESLKASEATKSEPEVANKSLGYGDPEIFSSGVSIPGKATSFLPVENFTLSKTYLFAFMGFMYFYLKGKI